jgi:hypothetical protein
VSLRSLGFIDTSMMTANLLVRHRESFMGGSIVLRDAEGDRPVLEKFKSAKNLLNRIKRLVGGDSDCLIRRAEIVSLPPGGFTPWQEEKSVETEQMVRVHVCLVPSPAAWLYCGGDAMVAPVGQLVLLNHRMLHSEINLGMNDRIHLVVDVVPVDAE